MADKEKRGEDENTKIQYKYLKNENNFLDEIKNIFMVFEGLYLVKNKNLIENSGTSFNNNDEHSQQETSIQIDEDITSNLENQTQSNKPNDGNFDVNLLNDLKLKFLYYHNIYKNFPLRERNFDTQVNYDIKEVELQLMNCIKDFI